MSPRESNSDHLSRSLSGDRAIIEATEAAREFGESQWLNDDELARLCVVVEELVANLYDHGGLSAKDEVALDFQVEPEGIRVCISDTGAAFDPWQAPRKAGAPERGGNVGIDIVREWASYISYSPSPDGNRLEFLLPVRWDR
ncbi:ATP-binding protein [Sphingomonas sp. NSE70-1]|uniref:ATP-binding protein n=1 Tax=Sphingomonas caseinilyticus TaxID=2908205 RepID=A0ABT0RTJ9_9SPHN|nr:ATP-binding protein [Sphingomonas caseinilyticus]MCL6698330.1 ATP-binding protein [Sphingomonas caseinilyticus]